MFEANCEVRKSLAQMLTTIFAVSGKSLTSLCLVGFNGFEDPERSGQLILSALAKASIKRIKHVQDLQLSHNKSWWSCEESSVCLITILG